jgi:hypothetical protein
MIPERGSVSRSNVKFPKVIVRSVPVYLHEGMCGWQGRARRSARAAARRPHLLPIIGRITHQRSKNVARKPISGSHRLLPPSAASSNLL